jgi:hypothetical protein
VLLRILNGTLFELYQTSRLRSGLPLAERNEQSSTFISQSMLSLSDAFFYPAPLTFQMTDFEQVQASVFQVARAPGKTIVYLGCFFLIVGIFAMLYVRERRLWVWLAPSAEGSGLQATMALSSNRKLMDNDRDFDTLFTTDKPIIFAYHGYPWLIHRLTYRRTNHRNLHVRGFKEEGSTTTPFDMVVLNDLDRFHLVMDTIDRLPQTGGAPLHLGQHGVEHGAHVDRITYRARAQQGQQWWPPRTALESPGQRREAN